MGDNESTKKVNNFSADKSELGFEYQYFIKELDKILRISYAV